MELYMNRRVFVIEFDDKVDPLWLNSNSLMACLTTKTHTSNVQIVITDITDDQHDREPVVGKGREDDNPPT